VNVPVPPVLFWISGSLGRIFRPLFLFSNRSKAEWHIFPGVFPEAYFARLVHSSSSVLSCLSEFLMA